MTTPLFVCPCCGYPGLTQPAYTSLMSRTVPAHGKYSPPYGRAFGTPSYDVCDCCGFEFGNDDEPGTAPPSTFEDYLRNWIQGGCTWFQPGRRPPNWSVRDQLREAGIDMPTVP